MLRLSDVSGTVSEQEGLVLGQGGHTIISELEPSGVEDSPAGAIKENVAPDVENVNPADLMLNDASSGADCQDPQRLEARTFAHIID